MINQFFKTLMCTSRPFDRRQPSHYATDHSKVKMPPIFLSLATLAKLSSSFNKKMLHRQRRQVAMTLIRPALNKIRVTR